MGQYEIYQWLKGHPNQKFTSKELAKALGVTQPAVVKSMGRMRKVLTVHDPHLKSEISGKNHYYLTYWYEDHGHKNN